MELGSRHVGSSCYVVETPSVIEPHQTEHRQENPYTHTRGPVKVEGVEVLETFVGVSGLEKPKCVYRGRRIQRQGIPQFHGVFGDDGRTFPRGEAEVVVTAQPDDLASVERKTRQGGTSQVESLKGRESLVFVVIPQVPETYSRH